MSGGSGAPKKSVFVTRGFWGAVAGMVGFGVLVLLPPMGGLTRTGQNAAGVGALMACFWVGEVVPIYVTALLPIVLFPPLRVLDPKAVTAPFGDQVVFLMMGGFMMAEAMQKWGLHRRIALYTIRLIGHSPVRIILGFMVATAFISMWMSNSATAVMMLPIALSVIWRVQDLKEDEKMRPDPFSTALTLSIAYSASIGGMATIVGTPPNAIFVGQVKTLFPQAPPIFFDQWMKVGLPVAVILLVITWLMLTRVLFPVHRQKLNVDRALIQDELAKLGPMGRGERTVLAVFVITAVLWMFRSLWSEWLPKEVKIDDSTIAIAAALALFLLPVDLKRFQFALDWKAAVKIPWGVLILFGGGFALAAGLQESGFAKWAGGNLKLLQGLHPLIHIALVCLILTFLTEVTSNTAITTIMLPIMAVSATALGVHPYLLMVACTISASCAFMLPSGTPPNAIVMGAGLIRLPQMAKTGVLLNFIGVAVVTLVVYYLGSWAFGMDLGVMPAWAAGK